MGHPRPSKLAAQKAPALHLGKRASPPRGRAKITPRWPQIPTSRAIVEEGHWASMVPENVGMIPRGYVARPGIVFCVLI